MADSNPLDSNFLSYIFNANAPAGAPTSYAALDTRRKIALAMMMRERKGYPKNIGEGLTAIGDALGERGAMNALAQQEAAYQKQLADNPVAIPGAIPPSVRTSEADVPDRVTTADVVPRSVEPQETPIVPPQVVASRSVEPPPVEEPRQPLPRQDFYMQQPPPPVGAPGTPAQAQRLAYSFDRTAGPNAGPPLSGAGSTAPPMAPNDIAGAQRLASVTGMMGGGEDYNYPRTALARPAGDVQSDAPGAISGVSPRVGAAVGDTAQIYRDMIARRLSGQPAPEVPQPNPTFAAGEGPPTAPSPLAAYTAGPPPEAQGNRPITMPDVVPASAAPAPVAGAQLAQAQRIEEPKLPDEPPLTKEERYGYELQRRFPGDPYYAQQAQGLIAYGAAQRAQQRQDQIKKYEQQYMDYRQQQEFERGGPKRDIEMEKEREAVTKAQQENRLRAQFGNMPPDEVFKTMTASRAVASSAAKSLTASQEAMRALEGGAILGSGAGAQLDITKFFNKLGLVDKGNIIANTETFRGAMQPVVASILHQTSGTSQLSEGELRFAERAAAGNITLDPQSIRQLMTIIDKGSRGVINEHQTKMDALFGENPQAKALYGVEMPKPVTGGVVDVTSEAEAAALPKGTKVRINGRTGTVQ